MDLGGRASAFIAHRDGRRSGGREMGARSHGGGAPLRQEHGFTYGILANHIWSVAGDSDRSDISATFLQPFFSYTTKTFTSFTINTESTYDWEDDEWSVPINFLVSQVLKIGPQPVSLQAGPRYWAESPDTGPEGWGFRFTFTLLFPK